MNRKDEVLFLITVAGGTIDIITKIKAFIDNEYFYLIFSIAISLLLLGVLLFLIKKYRAIIDTYKLVKFLLFEDVNNTFNFFPKLKIYMEYEGKTNDFDIDKMTFECTDNNLSKDTKVRWTMQGVYNHTPKKINTYCLYTTSETGTTQDQRIEIKSQSKYLKIEPDKIRRRNGIQYTEFAFVNPIYSNESIDQICVEMKMHATFDFSKQEVVYFYPRNYGKKVKNIEIIYNTIDADKLNIQLHEIKKDRGEYVDLSIRTCEYCEDGKEKTYTFRLEEKEIHVENLYYLLIRPIE